jgi:seryl-tRNA synthetase
MIALYRPYRRYSNLLLRPLIDFKELLKDPSKLKINAKERNAIVNVDLIEELNGKRVQMTTELNVLNASRKASNDLQCSKDIKMRRKELMTELSSVEEQFLTEMTNLPNWSASESPITENLVIKEHGTIDNQTSRADHMDICKQFDLVDFEGPARTTGAHFYALKGPTALLEMALTGWAFNRAIQQGFVPISVPDCIKERFIVGCGYQPRRNKDNGAVNTGVYRIRNSEDTSDPLVLAGTSEMYLASQHSSQILDSKQLPLKYVGLSHCFRSEVGHHTAASRGLYRVHQFTKVELFVLCEKDSDNFHFREITDLQESMLHELKLPFRVLEMARWELGAAAARKWDHEVWMSGRKLWGEVMSTSTCTDYQSRRLAIRHRANPQAELQFPWTLNGTACAVPRIIMALLENGWNPEEPSFLNLPKVLEQFYPSPSRTHNNLTIRFVQ